jgi:hypothetical protein
MIPGTLPDYVELGGRQVWRPPYTARAATLFGFVLEAEATAIDVLLEVAFNEPSAGAVHYRCAHPSVIVVFAAIERLASGDDPDEERGYISELEASVWCLAADVAAGSRLLWYLPYVFVDAGQAVASGREVFGYPKQMGVFEDDYPARLEKDGMTTTVSALAIDPFGKDEKAIRRPMLSARRDQGRALPDVGFPSLRDLLTDRLDVRPGLPYGPPPRPSGAITPAGVRPPRRPVTLSVPAWAGRRVLDTLLGRPEIENAGDLIVEMIENPTLVFLKQFRDVACPTKACYQAIVEAPLAIHPTTASYQALDPQGFTVTARNWDSHPIASDLGLETDPIVPQLAFRAEIDFAIQLGLEVWRAPT